MGEVGPGWIWEHLFKKNGVYCKETNEKIDLIMNLQYISDSNGKKLAIILPIKDYEKMLNDLEMLDDIRLYDEAKKQDDGSRILLSDYLEKRKAKNG